ncbi:hypothetical protein [Phenylobacterium sp.]|uniref:hypothetical protein n=1 Tax=Phenylobacterium sp. TaxID=1871053 RepID=UPI002DEE5B5C|nr:hypothetical protein [Phenylobacterium sp.]
MTSWLHDVAYVLGGGLLINAIPHLVAGLMGTPFRTPFSRMAGRPHSPGPVNVLWAALNLILAWALIARVGAFDPRSAEDALAVAAGGLLAGLHLARRSSRVD